MVRDKLGEEIAALDGVETTIAWAARSLGAKNTLMAEDATIVEAAFRERMQVLQPEVYSLTPAASEAPSSPLGLATRIGTGAPRSITSTSGAYASREPEQRLVLRIR